MSLIENLKRKKVLEGEWEIEEIFQILNSEEFDKICKWADEIRQECHGDDIHIRGIIEFSNYCNMNCLYCGLRKDNKEIQRYRLLPEEIISIALNIKNNYDIKTIVLQSGEDDYWTADLLSEIITKIKSEGDIAITLSIGERSKDDYIMLKKAGADRFLLKQETFTKEIYRGLHPNASFENRLNCILTLKELNYQTGSGIIIGLPNQSVKSIANDIYSMEKLGLDMIAIGPLIPNPHTPLGKFQHGDPIMTIKTLAAARIITKTPHIPATTALGTLDKEYQIKALKAGANVIMINFTPPSVRSLYEIYPTKNRFVMDEERIVMETKEMILAIGRKIGKDRGDSLQYHSKNQI